jgi:hypothetical protein
MADDLTPTDYAFLILLKIEGREIDNTEMGKRYGVKLLGPDCTRLNGEGYVVSETAHRPYRHALTQKSLKVLDGRSAYADLAAEPGAWVSLSRLRPLFGDVSKAELDKALGHLLDAPDVNLEPEPNQKTLKPEDRRAAVRIGGEDRHLLAIGM